MLYRKRVCMLAPTTLLFLHDCLTIVPCLKVRKYIYIYIYINSRYDAQKEEAYALNLPAAVIFELVSLEQDGVRSEHCTPSESFCLLT